nr:fibrinogen-like protein 1 [Crassostrea gigas]
MEHIEHLIQRRFDGSENFWRNWVDYENGFGSRGSEFWIGNRNIHELTNDGYTYLRIELMDHDCIWKYAEYSYFYVESDSNKYKLHVNGYSGDAEDSMWYHDGMFFSTYDNDNDYADYNCGLRWRGGWWYRGCHRANLNGDYGNNDYGDSMLYHDGMFFTTYDNDNDNASGNCGSVYRGAWWYNRCHNSNLNGEYENTNRGEGINWESWRGVYYSMKEVRMMVRKL